MTHEELDEYRDMLLKLKNKVLNSSNFNNTNDLHISSEDLSDEADLASSVIHQQIAFNMKTRELSKLRMIEQALARINDGSYGLCEDCDEEIERSRLHTQPWTNLCIAHAEERERESSKYAKSA